MSRGRGRGFPGLDNPLYERNNGQVNQPTKDEYMTNR
jgi:hypothetical protein